MAEWGVLISSIKDDSIYGVSNCFFQIAIWMFNPQSEAFFFPVRYLLFPSFFPVAQSAAGSLLDFSERSCIPSDHWHPVLVPPGCDLTYLVLRYHTGSCWWRQQPMPWLMDALSNLMLAQQSPRRPPHRDLLRSLGSQMPHPARDNCVDTHLARMASCTYLIFSKKLVFL